MWSEEGLRVEIRSVPDNTAMREYTNHHFRSPGEFTTSRLVSGASGKGFKICLEFDPEFRQYTANALKVEVVCCSAGTTTSQCYAIPLSDKHGAFQVRLDKWLRWNHSGAVPERGRTEIAYSLPEPINKEETARAGDDWTRDYGVANEGCVVVNIIRGTLSLLRSRWECGDRSSLVPPAPPHNIIQEDALAIDEAWFRQLKSDNCPVLFAEFMNVETIEGVPDLNNQDLMAPRVANGVDRFVTPERNFSTSLLDSQGPPIHSSQGPASSFEAMIGQNSRNRRSHHPKRTLKRRDYAESPTPSSNATESSSSPTQSLRGFGRRKRSRVVHSESPEAEHADDTRAVHDRRDQRAASNTPTAIRRESADVRLQDEGTRIKPEPSDSDDDCRIMKARAVTQNGPVTPRPTPSVISYGVLAREVGGTTAAQTQVSAASSKQRQRAKLQLDLETSLIRKKAALARIDAEAEFALQQKAIEKQLAELDEE